MQSLTKKAKHEGIVNNSYGYNAQYAPHQYSNSLNPQKPKRAASAYLFYLADIRPKFTQDNPSLSFSDITIILASNWKNLSEREKKSYIALAMKDKERYLQENTRLHTWVLTRLLAINCHLLFNFVFLIKNKIILYILKIRREKVYNNQYSSTNKDLPYK